MKPDGCWLFTWKSSSHFLVICQNSSVHSPFDGMKQALPTKRWHVLTSNQWGRRNHEHTYTYQALYRSVVMHGALPDNPCGTQSILMQTCIAREKPSDYVRITPIMKIFTILPVTAWSADEGGSQYTYLKGTPSIPNHFPWVSKGH